MAMDFASILSAEYAEKMKAAGTLDADRPRADRHRPVPVRLVPEGRGRSATRRTTATGAAARRSTTSCSRSRTDASVRYAKLKTGECHVMAFPKPADVALMKADPNINLISAARPEHRLHRVQRREEAVRQQAGAPGAEHGGQQEGDPRRGVPGRGPGRRRTRSRRPCGATTTRSTTTRTTRPRRRRCSRRPATRTASRSTSGTCR